MPLSRKSVSEKNQSNLVTKELSKAIMKRYKLRNRFLKEKSEVSRKAYTYTKKLLC